MCGIAGFVDFTGSTSMEALIQMTDSLKHRGPDDAGYEIIQLNQIRIGLGHRRLAIIDLSSNGHQPMHYRDWVILFNGEIYNYREIRAELITMGYTFHSNSDTEIILRAFDKWGLEACQKFIGMFAIVLYNKAQRKIYLFRDRVGVKPLYFYWNSSRILLFGSELKALKKHPDFKVEIDLNGLASYFKYGYIQAPYSIFKDTYKLRPGHFLELNLNTKAIQENQYWDAVESFRKPILDISEHEALKQVELKLKQACEYRMVSDVPVGLFLSGGYDSSIVAALLQSNRSERIRTFTIGFENPQYDESKYARNVASFLGTNHTEYICTEKEAKGIISVMSDFYDEPFGDASAIPTILVSTIARKSVTVALSADGGDEIFGGYRRYGTTIKNLGNLSKIPRSLQQLAGKIMREIPSERIPILNRRYRFNHYYFSLQSLLTNGLSIDTLYDLSCQYLNDLELQELLNGTKIPSNTYQLSGFRNSPLNSLIIKDLHSYLPDDILVKVDRATMSTSLEAREPLLDHNIIEYIARLPSTLKIKKGEKKYLLKQITHQYIPKEMLNRPKQGFALPLVDWLRNDLKPLLEEGLHETLIKNQGIFNHIFVNKRKKEYLSGRNDHFEFIWFMLNFQLWYKKWI